MVVAILPDSHALLNHSRPSLSSFHSALCGVLTSFTERASTLAGYTMRATIHTRTPRDSIISSMTLQRQFLPI